MPRLIAGIATSARFLLSICHQIVHARRFCSVSAANLLT